ncbi:MAG: carbohydrate kinase [Eubacteriales bacterium]|nr:carbohydrate kinase [Eubacteriales bacterium]
MDLYSIGEMVIDFIPGNEPDSYIRKAGGAPANVAFAVAKNGLEAGMNCSLGDDDFGHFLMDTLAEYKVRCLNPRLCKKAITTMAFVTLAKDGDRSFTFARKPGADMFLEESDVREEDIDQSVIIHAGSCSLSASPVDAATKKALRLGREKGKLVSFDVNYRNLMWEDDQDACAASVMECLPDVDILKISEEEAPMMGGEDGLENLMKKYNLTLLVETLGSEGARCFFDGRVFHVPGRKAVCVDATGAGDAFWGGLLSSLRLQGVKKASDLTEEIVRRAMEYGNIAGWLCVQSKGAIPSLPTREQIEQYLQ